MLKDNAVKQDIFDLISEEEPDDIFNEVEAEDSAIDGLTGKMKALLEEFDSKDRRNENRKLSDEMKDFIRSEVAKIKPKQNVIERTIERKIEPQVFHVEPKIVEAPPQIIKEVRVEVEKKDKTKYVEESKYLDLLVKISKLENQLKETRAMAEQPLFMPGGSGVIGIPPPEPNPAGYVLTVNSNRKAQWKAASGSVSPDAYTPSNVTTVRTFDASNVSIDELANTLGSLIASLQGAGIIQ